MLPKTTHHLNSLNMSQTYLQIVTNSNQIIKSNFNTRSTLWIMISLVEDTSVELNIRLLQMV